MRCEKWHVHNGTERQHWQCCSRYTKRWRSFFPCLLSIFSWIYKEMSVSDMINVHITAIFDWNWFFFFSFFSFRSLNFCKDLIQSFADHWRMFTTVSFLNVQNTWIIITDASVEIVCPAIRSKIWFTQMWD